MKKVLLFAAMFAFVRSLSAQVHIDTLSSRFTSTTSTSDLLIVDYGNLVGPYFITVKRDVNSSFQNPILVYARVYGAGEKHTDTVISEGLSPDTKYYYRIFVSDSKSDDMCVLSSTTAAGK